MRILSEADVTTLITIEDAISAAERAYRLQAEGGAQHQARADTRRETPKAGCLVLAGMFGSDLVVKSNVHAYPGGPFAPRLWGSLLTLWDLERATPRALVSAQAFNDHRTASGFAAAAKCLSQPDATTFAVFGAGKTAPMTVRYLKAARPSLSRLYLVGRNPERVAQLKVLLSQWPEFADVDVMTTASPEAAVSEADIVATVTTSDHPVFPGHAVKAGACVILGGANRPTAREADDALMRCAVLYVDARAGVFEKSGDLALALASGAITRDTPLIEIGSCLDGPSPEVSAADIRVFKSMGLAVQDAVLAEHLVSRAEALGLGTMVDLQGSAA